MPMPTIDADEEEYDPRVNLLPSNARYPYGSVNGNGSDMEDGVDGGENDGFANAAANGDDHGNGSSSPLKTAGACTSTAEPDTVSISAASMSSVPVGDNAAEGKLVTLTFRVPTLRRVALELSLYVNLIITAAKLVAYIQTLSLSVLAALLDSVLDVVSQVVLNYTEKHSSLQRSSAFYPAGASRLEPIGVLTCAALMGMASFEVLKESFTTLAYHEQESKDQDGQHVFQPTIASCWAMLSIVFVKLFLLWLCNKAANKRVVQQPYNSSSSSISALGGDSDRPGATCNGAGGATATGASSSGTAPFGTRAVVQLADPTLEALAQDHWNDILSNAVAAVALLCVLKSPSLWFLDPVGAIFISFYIIYSWYVTGREQIEQLTGKAAPEDLIEELMEIASDFDARMQVDCIRAYHFGPKFLVEIEMVMPKTTLLFESRTYFVLHVFVSTQIVRLCVSYHISSSFAMKQLPPPPSQMIWAWNCNMKLKAEKKLNDALFTLTTRLVPMTSMLSARCQSCEKSIDLARRLHSRRITTTTFDRRNPSSSS
jgi:cation diffusion facilitator family transporter